MQVICQKDEKQGLPYPKGINLTLQDFAEFWTDIEQCANQSRDNKFGEFRREWPDNRPQSWSHPKLQLLGEVVYMWDLNYTVKYGKWWGLVYQIRTFERKGVQNLLPIGVCKYGNLRRWWPKVGNVTEKCFESS